MQNDVNYLWIFILVHGLALVVSIIWSVCSIGVRQSIRFFIPVFIAGFALEAAGVLTGKYGYPEYPLQMTLGGHSLPLFIIIGWSNIFFYFRMLARILAGPAGSLINISSLTALSGTVYDLVQDPIALKLGWWNWSGHESEAVFWDVPVTNFSAWFVFLFFITLFLELIEKKPWSENRKLAVSILGLPVAGFLMLAGQMIFRGLFNLIGWL